MRPLSLFKKSFFVWGAFAFLTSSGLIACGGGNNSNSGGPNPLRAFIIDEVGTSSFGQQCRTGRHEFGRIEDYCRALQNEQLNQNCAQQRRQQLFQQNCTNVNNWNSPNWNSGGNWNNTNSSGNTWSNTNWNGGNNLGTPQFGSGSYEIFNMRVEVQGGDNLSFEGQTPIPWSQEGRPRRLAIRGMAQKSQSAFIDYCVSPTVEFTNQASFCAALQDNTRMTGCAEGLRQDLHTYYRCGGGFNPNGNIWRFEIGGTRTFNTKANYCDALDDIFRGARPGSDEEILSREAYVHDRCDDI